MIPLNHFDKLQDNLKSIESQLSSREEKSSNYILQLVKIVENFCIALNDNIDIVTANTAHITPE